MPDKLAYSVNEFADVSGLKKSSIYKLIRSGKLPSIWIGGKRLIPAEAGQQMLRDAQQDAFQPMRKAPRRA
jgi:excisionase family DNA binding protein